MNRSSFAARLHAAMAARSSRVCLGLDPRPELLEHTHPDAHGGSLTRVAAAVAEHLTALLDATHDVVACCKPQSAFFEALGTAGMEALARVVAHARSLDLPVIVDAKRGDIGSTAEAYAAAFVADGGPFSGDALTVNPFLGFDSLEPLAHSARATGRGLFVLVKTSNPGSKDFQELRLASGRPVYLHLAELVDAANRSHALDEHGYGALGAVVGATNRRQEVRELRAALKSSVLLVPGYGAQGGAAADVVEAFDSRRLGAVISSSRTLNYPPAADGSLATNVRAARAAAIEMRDEIERALDAA
ncbi:MAG: orotidine-5'-phosphate decarboxylase [Trueperaceae bacterium]|nr:orotidine-5'-phosphate decarboxylase [Trueperaceae bacterium]